MFKNLKKETKNWKNDNMALRKYNTTNGRKKKIGRIKKFIRKLTNPKATTTWAIKWKFFNLQIQMFWRITEVVATAVVKRNRKMQKI